MYCSTRLIARSLFLALIVLGCGLPKFGHAQDPRVFIIFDTSGSMLWDYSNQYNCASDGSLDYPHFGSCTNQSGSKLYHAKQALRQVINAHPNIEFALLRYGQLEPADPTFGDQQTFVGAQYRRTNGEIISTNYDGSTNGCGPADYLVQPSQTSNFEILTWIDGVENYPANKELRANGYTPLTQSMDSVLDAIRSTIALDVDARCRAYYVLLLTDGYQQCPNEDYESSAYRAMISNQLQLKAEALRVLNQGGDIHDVRTFVIGFGPGTQFATELDELARSGGTAVNGADQIDLINGNAYQANDPNSLSVVLERAIANASPREQCDGVDNDCDNRIDEGFPTLGRACTEGMGACAEQGQLICDLSGEGVECSANGGLPLAEVCDGQDNDCDLRVDEGTQNACGTCGQVVEVCDGRDNDCDNAVDEGVQNACGGCGRLPIEVCNGGDDDCDGRVDEGVQNACGGCGPTDIEACDCNDNDCDNRIDEGLSCGMCNCTPSPETCNGVDDDCDLRIDEGTQNQCNRCGNDLPELCNGLDEDCDGRFDEGVAEVGTPCGEAQGACQAGTYQCQAGQLICAGEVAALVEVCDNQDNDCDGRYEEGLLNACNQCGPSYGEVCDNIDNDCDGRDDTRDLCGETFICVNGECAQPCVNGECFGGRICVDGGCSTPCVNRDCPSGHVCNQGACVDPCLGSNCRVGTYCSLGRCLPDDCYGRGCGEGQICTGGQCVPDPCATANCGPQQGCIDGRCFEDCDAVICPEGTVCENGLCTDDPCLRITCAHDSVCQAGTCIPDPCFERECNLGFMCDLGECVEDPCLRTTCPMGDTCHRGICSSAIPNAQPPTNIGGGDPLSTAPTETPQGCQCDSSGYKFSWDSLFLMISWVLGALALRRKQRVGI